MTAESEGHLHLETTSATPRRRGRPLSWPRLGLGHLFWVATAALMIGAAWLRLYGLGFGLPATGYYWDEPIVMNRAIRFGSGDLNPNWFYYPTFYMYQVFAAIGGYALVGLATRRFDSIDSFAVEYFLNPTNIYLVARGYTALLGTAIVFLTVLIGRRWHSGLTGWLAGLVVAVSALHATYSAVIVTDMPQALFITAASLALLAILAGGGWRTYVLAGLMIGFGAASKYLAILVLPGMVLAHLLRSDRPARLTDLAGLFRWCLSPRLIAGGVATGIAFFIGTPFTVLSLGRSSSQIRVLAIAQENYDTALSIWTLLNTVPNDLGWPLLVLGLVGLGLLLRHRPAASLVLLAFPAIYLLLILALPRNYPRYMLPLTPFLAVGASYALVTGVAWLQRAMPVPNHRLKGWALMAAMTLVLIYWPLQTALTWKTLVVSTTDPRTSATLWLHEHVRSGTPIAVQELFGRRYLNTPVLTKSVIEKIANDIPTGGRFDRIRQRVLDGFNERPVYADVPFAYDLTALRAQGARYVIVSQPITDFDLRWNDKNGSVSGFQRDLQSQTRLVARFAQPLDLALRLPFDAPELAVPYTFPEIFIYEIA